MIRPTTLGLLTALALAAPTVASAASQREVAARAEAAPGAPTKAAATDASSYAHREQHDPQVAGYEGGSVVIVGVSGGALVALLLILLLL